MAKFLFTLAHGSDNPNRAVRCFQFAKVAKELGHEVNIFLIDDGVYLTHPSLMERIKAATGDELQVFWKYLVDNGVTIRVCKPCAEARMITNEDLPPGAVIDTAKTLISLAAESQVFNF